MKRRSSSWGLIALFSAGVAYLALSIDWRPARSAAPPRLVVRVAGADGVKAGAARIALDPLLPAVVAGYPPPRSSANALATPLDVRALVLEAGGRALALVSVEILLVPQAVVDGAREAGRRLGLDEVVVVASHAHSSFGGFDPRLFASVAATGRYRAEVVARLDERIAAALEAASASRAPVLVRSGTAALGGLTRNRAVPGGAVDPELTLIALDATETGATIARLFVVAAHPTLVPRHGDRLDGDWPGRAMRELEKEGGVAMFLPGALGDAAPTPAPGPGTAPEEMARAVSAGATAAREVALPGPARLAFAAARVALPAADVSAAVPRLLARPAANLVDPMAPREADVSILWLGDRVLALVPAEATFEAAHGLRARVARELPGTAPAVVVTMAQGYAGYLETAERVRGGAGEAARTWFGPGLAGRMEDALGAAARALREAR